MTAQSNVAVRLLRAAAVFSVEDVVSAAGLRSGALSLNPPVR